MVPPEREVTEILCPVHETPVFKVVASQGIVCHIWDPRLGLTIDQIRNRFPFAVWDSNLHRTDETPGAKFPIYNLVCDRCMTSWEEYAKANPPPPKRGMMVSITGSGKILINETEFSIDQIPAVAEAVANHQARPRLYLRTHETTPVDLIKAVMAACAEHGITDVVFSSMDDEEAPDPDRKRIAPE